MGPNNYFLWFISKSKQNAAILRGVFILGLPGLGRIRYF